MTLRDRPGESKRKYWLATSILGLGLTIFTSSILHSETAPADTPAARRWLQALQARRDKFDRLIANVERLAVSDGKQSKVPPALGCPIALESALVIALTETHFMRGSNEEFHLLIHGEREKEYLDISYTYNQTGARVVTAINKLPTGWTVGFSPGELNANNFIVLSDREPSCIFEFDSADPFASKAVVSQPE
jgi:hypothetical protein